VIDYATKYTLAITVTPTARGADALACLRLARRRRAGLPEARVTEAERVLDLDDLRADRWLAQVFRPAGEMLGVAPAPIAVVSDSGPCFAERYSRPRSTDQTRCCDTSAPGCDHPRPTASSKGGSAP
jgi:hypothetical protein